MKIFKKLIIFIIVLGTLILLIEIGFRYYIKFQLSKVTKTNLDEKSYGIIMSDKELGSVHRSHAYNSRRITNNMSTNHVAIEIDDTMENIDDIKDDIIRLETEINELIQIHMPDESDDESDDEFYDVSNDDDIYYDALSRLDGGRRTMRRY